jgi:hypothetical protein
MKAWVIGLVIILVIIIVIAGVAAYLVLSGAVPGVSIRPGATVAPSSQVYVYLTDKPVKVDHLYVTISKVLFHREGGGNETWVSCSLTGTTFDLAQLVNTSQLMAQCSLPNGTYNIIRLVVVSVQAVVNGQTYNCTLPSGRFEVPLGPSPIIVNGTSYDVTVDFGAVNHVVMTGNGKCIVMPVIHVSVKKHS